MREGGERRMVLAAAAREDGQAGKIGHSGEDESRPRALDAAGQVIATRMTVAEPPELSRLKCVGRHHKGNTSSNTLQTEQFLVCRVTSRYNHRFSDRTSIPRTKASPEILQPQFYNSGKVMITNQFKPYLQNQLK